MRTFSLAAAFFVVVTSGAPARAQATRPTLVVLIAVDQVRGDYLDRFGPQFHGGLARLMRGGARFTNAHSDHAITETAPGHASMLSGRFPRSTGIAWNREGVEDPAVAIVGAPSLVGASPKLFKGTTLVDWMHDADPRSRALSVSRKDRSAILPIGRSKQQVYWYVADGRFTTSTYYTDTVPSWVTRYNERRVPQRYAGKAWTPLLPDSAYREIDSVPIEGGPLGSVFPHAIPGDSTVAAAWLVTTPQMDDVVIDFALTGLAALGLGSGPQIDLLNLALSSPDAVGHAYGPDSKEMHDDLLRLDQAVGVFLDSLYKLRDSSHVAVVLVSDHGVAPIPELAAGNAPPKPSRVELWSLLDAIRARLHDAGVDTNAIQLDGPVVALDRSAFKGKSVNPDTVLSVFARAARQVPNVRRVDRFADLWKADTVHDAIARRWTHQFAREAPVSLVVTLAPGSTWGGNIASHGSPYDYDSHVPLIFYGPAFVPGQYSDFVRTVDVAPTLAAILGVKPGEKIDGVVLGEAIRP